LQNWCAIFTLPSHSHNRKTTGGGAHFSHYNSQLFSSPFHSPQNSDETFQAELFYFNFHKFASHLIIRTDSCHCSKSATTDLNDDTRIQNYSVKKAKKVSLQGKNPRLLATATYFKSPAPTVVTTQQPHIQFQIIPLSGAWKILSRKPPRFQKVQPANQTNPKAKQTNKLV